ncbi:hypothetical protein [Actinoallomurus sp. NPDC052274]
MHMRRLPDGFTGRRCTCGALIEIGNRICRKCRCRARWQRRKARNDWL